MTASLCAMAGCNRPVTDAHVCKHCRTDFDQRLRQVPELVRELEAAMAREARSLTSTERIGFVDAPLPVDLVAGKLLNGLADALDGAVDLVIGPSGEAHAPGLTRDRPSALAGWLHGRTEQLRHHPKAGPVMDRVTGVVRDGWEAVDLPVNRTVIPVGPCPQDTDKGPCPGEVRAYIPADRTTTARMECVTCGAVWWPWQWTRAGHRILGRRADLRPHATRRLLAKVCTDLTRSA